MIVRLSGLIWRSLHDNRRRSVMAFVGSGLGIGLLVAILCLAAMARAGVEQQLARQFSGIELVIGSSTGTVNMSAADVARIRELPGVRAMGPVLMPFLGDEFEVEQMTRYVGVSPDPNTLQLFELPRPVANGEVMLNRELATHLGVSAGQNVTLPFPDQPRTFKVGGVVTTELRASSPYIAYFSLEGLQNEVGRQGEATVLYITVDDYAPAVKASVAHDIEKLLKEHNPAVANNLIVDTALEADEARRNVGGLRTLGMMAGGLSLLVSMLLVMGMTQFTLRERLQEIALLRAVGARRKQAIRTLMGEVLLLGGLGALVGGVAGVLLALASGRLVSAILGVPLVAALPAWSQLLAAMAAGWLLQALAAWAPVRRATKVPPVQAARQADDDEARPSGHWGPPVAALLLAALLQGIARTIPLRSGEEIKLLVVVVSAVLAALGIFGLASLVLSGVIFVLRPLLALSGRELIIAVRNVLNMQRQSRLTTAILGSALAIAVMAFTLIQTLATEQKFAFETEFPTPLVAASRRGGASTIPWDKALQVGQLPGVARSAAMGVSVPVDWANQTAFPVEPAFRQFWTHDGGVLLWVMPVDMKGLAELGLVGRELVGRDRAAVITREMARQTGLKVGDLVRAGKRPGRFPKITADTLELRVGAIVEHAIAGVRDSDILVDRDSLPLREAPMLEKVLIDVEPGQQALVESALTDLGSSIPELAWSTEATARAALDAKVGQYYAVLSTSVAVISLMGLLATINTLTASLHSRRREHAMLRAAGLSASRFSRLVLAENLLFALGAVLTGVMAGLAFTYMAIVPLGGWALRSLTIPWPAVGALAGLTLTVTVVVSSLATRRAARAQVLEILRQE